MRSASSSGGKQKGIHGTGSGPASVSFQQEEKPSKFPGSCCVMRDGTGRWGGRKGQDEDSES
eukprot:164951-Hanusia_phi.AAC.1